MSVRSLTWALYDAPVSDPVCVLVLAALAERSSDTGKCAWPSIASIAKVARCSDRTVQRALRVLEDKGLIRRGDQQFVAHLRADKRPVVWDLCLPERDDNLTPRRRSGVTNTTERGDKYAPSGVTRVSPKPSTSTKRRTCDVHEWSLLPCRGCAADKLAGDIPATR